MVWIRDPILEPLDGLRFISIATEALYRLTEVQNPNQRGSNMSMTNTERGPSARWAAAARGILAATAAVAVGGLLAATPAHAYSRGVNMAGLDFNSGNLPGALNTDYTQNSEASYTYFGNKGLTLIRVSFTWERLQPTLNGNLDATYLSYITNNINWAKLHGCKVIVDVHSYGAYRGGGIDKTGSGVTTANLTNLWTKLSTQWKNETGIYAYDIMNEPVNAANWHSTSQAVVTAIRNNGDNKLIMVPGSAWESAGSYSTDNGATKWITDPANNMKYSAHMYFDHDNSGTYGWTYDQEIAANSNLAQIGVQRFDVFKNWCVSNGVQGYIGEFGCPGGDSRWFPVMNNFYNDLDSAGFDGTYWAAGEWWGTYPLSCQPTNNYTTDAPQMATILAHKGTASPPSPPTGLTASAGNAQVALSWSTSSGATAYDVKRSTVSGSGYATISSPTSTSYTNTGLTNGTTYYYVVAAKNANGSSANSSQASATPNAGTSGPAKVNAGGPAASPFIADIDFSGGTVATNWTGAITTTGVTSPAPQAVYQSERYGAMTYTMGGLTSGANYTVRLHFCENFFTAAAQRKFNVAINGTTVLTNFDIFATTGAIHKATVQQFTAAANTSGRIVVAFTNVTNNALINGIEVNSTGGGTTINYGGGFNATGLQRNGSAVLNGTRLRLTNGTSNQNSSAFYTTKVNVASFNTTFSFQLSSGSGTGDGITFCIQNNATTTIGGGGNGLGYQGIASSAAIKFDLFTDGGEGANPTGLFTGGAAPTTPSLDMTPNNVLLHSGHVFNVNLSYNGTTLTQTVTDATTGAVYTHGYTVNIPSVVGASTAYVGFTGSSGGAVATQEIISWTY
jgi:endoglucanase